MFAFLLSLDRFLRFIVFDLLLLLHQALLAYSSEKTCLIEDAQVQKLQAKVEQLKEQLKLKDAVLAKAQNLAEERLKDNVALCKVLDSKLASNRPPCLPAFYF